ncbi:MAG: cyclic nucleotide-binding domain-containing protein [Nitriliruptorales bacterium]|nr:cyclic nucleotide-binding domain-containing protein [Nitriliruptorales bacterium]
MRHESSVTSISWIPSEAMSGMMRLPMDIGLGHYDDPPPDVIEDLEALREADRFRFANELRAFIEVEDDEIVDAGYLGGGHIGATTMNLGVGSVSIAAVPFDDLQQDPVVDGPTARFVQTAGGRTGSPFPRRVPHPPFIRLTAPTAWTTLGLTLHADGSSELEVVGASPFPRHWIYDAEGKLAQKSGTTDFKSWTQKEHDEDTPWGGVDSEALVTQVETALERELSLTIMREGKKPEIRRIDAGDTLTEQGEQGDELFLLLDGVARVEVDGEGLAEIGPGTVVGERAILEGGERTATLTAVTPLKVAVADGDSVDRDALVTLSEGHRREEQA